MTNTTATTYTVPASKMTSGRQYEFAVRAIATELGERGVRTRRGNLPDNRWVEYILENPTYIGKIRWSTEGHANYSRANYDASNVLLVDGRHEPIIDLDTWDAVQKKRASRSGEVKYMRKSSYEMFMLKGLVRCDSCGSTLTFTATKNQGMQCHSYARGQCHVSHFISIKKANAIVIEALEEVARTRQFQFAPKKIKPGRIVHEWDKLIASEEHKLERAKLAVLEGAFEPSDYIRIKAEISETLTKLRAGKAAEAAEEEQRVDPTAYAKKVADVLEIVKAPDISEQAKNEALRTIIDKIVFNKPAATFDLYFAP